MLRYQWRGWKWLGVFWFILMTVLFCLPGSALPKAHWLDKIYFDKWVHIGLFAVAIFFWRFSFPVFSSSSNWLLLLLAFGYGLSIEFIQKYWIPGRSFDLWDVAADMTGAVGGLLIWLRVYMKKNKPL